MPHAVGILPNPTRTKACCRGRLPVFQANPDEPVEASAKTSEIQGRGFDDRRSPVGSEAYPINVAARARADTAAYSPKAAGLRSPPGYSLGRLASDNDASSEVIRAASRANLRAFRRALRAT